MKLNIELYLKVDSVGTGWVYKRPITGNGSQTHMVGDKLDPLTAYIPEMMHILNQHHSRRAPISNSFALNVCLEVIL